MSTSTTNLHLTKPAASEHVDIDVINSNYDIIDQFAGTAITDPSYVHTDNNYTSNEKTKLAGLDNYILPTASTSTKGGVKLDGDTITIDSNGVISASIEANPQGSATGDLSKLKIGSDIFSIPTGGGGGTDVEWTQIVQSGTKIAEIEIDGNTTNVYAPTSGGGYTEVTGTLTAGLTSITLSDVSITANSTIDVYTDNDVEYNSISVSTGNVTITFDAQASNIGVKVRVS